IPTLSRWTLTCSAACGRKISSKGWRPGKRSARRCFAGADPSLLLANAHRYPDGHGFRRRALAHTAHRCRRPVVETHAGADIGRRGADPVRRIEPDPAEVGHEGLGPGVTSVVIAAVLPRPEIAADITCGNAQGLRRCNEDMRMILADAGAFQ